VRFEVLAAMKMPFVVFWVVTPCGLVVVSTASEERIASIFKVKYHLKAHTVLNHEDYD
jgi:hypothetical protein